MEGVGLKVELEKLWDDSVILKLIKLSYQGREKQNCFWGLKKDALDSLVYLLKENVLRSRPITFIDTSDYKSQRLVWRMAPTTEGTVLMVVRVYIEKNLEFEAFGEMELTAMEAWLEEE